MQNILVDEVGTIMIIIDWECVSALPLWRACQISSLLKGRQREEEPRREDYAPDEPENEYQHETYRLDNEGVNSLYWIHLLEYEGTHLRRFFLSEMELLQPEWVEEWKRGILKAGFEVAVHNADNGFCFKIIRKWLDAYNSGERWSLRDDMVK